MQIQNYEIIRELGRGTFGVTYLGRDVSTGQQVAVKTIDIHKSAQHGADLNSIREEIDTLYDLTGQECPNYVACFYKSFKDSWEGSETMFIISEYINGSSLTEFIRRNYSSDRRQNRLTPHILWSLYLQLLSGLQYIHSRGYAHRDIKPDNIMITRDFKIKYIDFGLACMDRCRVNNASCTNVCKTGPGTLLYMAPEFFNGQRTNSLAASQAGDMWALAVVMMEMANGLGAFPFEIYQPDGNYLSEEVLFENIRRAPTYLVDYKLDDGRTNNFVNSVLQPDWTLRPTVYDALGDIAGTIFAPVFFSR